MVRYLSEDTGQIKALFAGERLFTFSSDPFLVGYGGGAYYN
jgi:hypothetical protein